MDRYEVMAGKMAPLTDGAHRKWGFAGKVETRSYERLVDALIDFVETGDGLKARFLTGFAACLAADRKSVENRGFGVAVRKVQCHRGEDGTVRVSSVETMHERRYTVDDWRYDTAHCEQTENLQFMTYSAAMMTARRGEEISGYDVVVADEFHNCGAEEWGKGVTHILDANESAKVVGFSATPIRYSDGGRNMADEMFDGNVAYSMELEEAWLRGILPIPKYVTAFYEAPKELGRLAKSIAGIKDEMVMKRFQKKYENLRRSLTEAGCIREAIAKHLKKRDAKVIVFCPRVAKLREFMLLRREWFGAVNSEIHAYKTVSADPYGSEDFQAFKDDESDALKVLYCVNQLNEAVHVKGVDAIVMVRPTKSPTVFYQQLGRVLSSGGNRTPLVFDFCNNFGSIVAAERIPKRMEETFKRLTGESEQLPFTPSDFRIIDRTLTFRQLTDEIRKSLKQQSIEDKITFLEQMAQLNGGKL